jgi:hypothetical protein
MKKKMFFAMVVLGTIGVSSQLFAQETMELSKSKTKSNQSNDRTTEQNTVVCTGKVRCGDGTCTIDFDQEIISPRDAASGLPTGKRMHKPFVITKELDRSSAAPVRESPTKASTGKVSVSDINIMLYTKGKSRTLSVVNGQFNMPDDCDDQDCDLIVSWSWGASQSGSTGGTAGSGISRYQATFNLTVDKGEFMASKHTKTGHVTLMK